MSVKSIQGQFVALGCFMYKGIKKRYFKKKSVVSLKIMSLGELRNLHNCCPK